MPATSPLANPVVLRGSLHETIWGGQRLSTIAGKQLPEGGMIGESWETATDSIALNVPFAGSTLGELVAQYGADLLGWRAVQVFGPRFPLLAKFIDAQQWLSVQVHPDDSYAAEHEGGKLGKTETWYILDAEPGAQLVYGLKRQASPDEVRSAIEQTRLEDLMLTMPAHAGDVIFVPAGTVHAIGAGICLYELQEYSDVTYRLYDYGRVQANGQPRELHVEEGLEVMRFGPAERPRAVPLVLPADYGLADGLADRRVLVACPYFVLEELRIHSAYTASVVPSSCQILSVLDGSATLQTDGAEHVLKLGDTAVLPAALGRYRLSSSDGRVVRSYVPVAGDELLSRWEAAQSAGR